MKVADFFCRRFFVSSSQPALCMAGQWACIVVGLGGASD